MKTLVYASLICLLAKTAITAQVAVFNNPSSWMTLREKEVEANVLLDTARAEKNSVRITLIKHANNSQRTISNRVYTIDEFPQNLVAGTLQEDVIGGEDFIQLQWSVPGTDHEGKIAPVGIAVLDSVQAEPLLSVRKLSSVSDIASLRKAVGDSMVSAGSYSVAAGYTDSVLYLYMEKDSGQAGTITFAFDGKNAKNAFLTYSDRFISYADSTDSLSTYHYTRSFRSDTIAYERNVWYAGVSEEKNENQIMVAIPWHDLGFLPFDGRRFGLAMFVTDGAERAVPQAADRQLPASWGNAILQ